MTQVAEGAQEAGAEIIGVIPQRIVSSGRESNTVTQQIYVNNMAERKQNMRLLADLFVVFPGSYGTMDELFDVMASGTVGEHHKPLILFNLNNFYTDLIHQLQHMRQEDFIPAQPTYQYLLVQTLDELCRTIETITTKSGPKHQSTT